MLHGFAAATLEILKDKVDQRSFNRIDSYLLDFSFSSVTQQIENILAVVQT